MKSRIKIQIIPTRLGCWTVLVGGFQIIKSTRDPLVEIARRLLAAGHKQDARILMTRSPAGPCRLVSTIGDAAAADVLRHPFRSPDWVALHANGSVQCWTEHAC
jgi:hypothetical protein